MLQSIGFPVIENNRIRMILIVHEVDVAVRPLQSCVLVKVSGPASRLGCFGAGLEGENASLWTLDLLSLAIEEHRIVVF